MYPKQYDLAASQPKVNQNNKKNENKGGDGIEEIFDFFSSIFNPQR